jgi:hypothetical protein
MRRGAVLAALVVSALLASVAVSAAAEWRSEQPVGEGGFQTRLGEVGDIECRSGEANRCVLITAGNGGVAPGIFAFDGSGWYRYSTVCGGHEGSIAWAGPDEFWTISDQQRGQEVEGAAFLRFAISLCHFKGGRVVASYGEPLGVQGAYLHMNAAACSGPSDCWFAGARLPGSVNQGAFHLHWDGSSLRPAPSLSEPQSEILDPGRAVTGIAVHQGDFYEGVRVAEGDVAVPGEAAEPSFVHSVGAGAAQPFEPLFPAAPIEYGAGAEASELGGFHLTDDGQRLWAVSGATGTAAQVTVMRLGAEGLAQLPLEESESLDPGYRVSGAAAEPGADDVWIGFRRSGDSGGSSTPARLTRIAGDGSVGAEVTLPAEDEGPEPSGPAGPLTCAAAEQCWMATQFGWLFHLGPDPEPNHDPAMHGAVITVRPRDNSLPIVPPIALPEDDSGAEGKAGVAEEEELPAEFEDLPPRRRPALLSKVEQRLLHGTILELTFTLRAKAHVQLLAKRAGRVVAKTKRFTMDKGHRSLRLRLDPKRWPTKLDLQAHPVKGAGAR